ncbi:tRNA (adenosine(37)-N6)-threonylcarbamoyltransferase complex transferase subunit TsaD [Babesia caballi]|uniref:N(6)-L-threonylcarbamoyladenine synthase n=1 Tax=Babesia caballi TaxID=5871 RepID=A0AAV4LN04_BABCB|nr:tRNA (adenosine(37)-N6)-threonylcarbamoyltransferase complex transferase subunit TsaD [Babesia caballi]
MTRVLQLSPGTSIPTSVPSCCSDGKVLAEERASNPESLIKFGGIKPDESYRFHLRHLGGVVERVLANSGVNMADVKRIAVTRGPGMNICLKAGYDMAAELASKHGIPLICENHLAGHCLSPFIKGHQVKITYGRGKQPTAELRYPFLSLLLSGGHSQIYVVEGPAKFHMLADTMDHYAGNVLYKCAKELGLPIENGGGPSVEDAATRMRGDPIFAMTEPCRDMSFTSFCFSGIQTQLREILIRLRQQYGDNVTKERPDVVYHLAYTCQEVVFQQIVRQLNKTLDVCDTLFGINQLVVVGGVSCNERLRELIAETLHDREDTFEWRTKAFVNRMYSHVKKAGPLRRFKRSDAQGNVLVQNLVERMRGVTELPQLLRLLWSQDLHPDLLQRREGIHLSVQQKNALYGAVLQAYLSLLSASEAYSLHRNLQARRLSGMPVLSPSPAVMSELVKLEQQHSSLVARKMNASTKAGGRWQLFTTSASYCTDNAVMIAYSLLEKHRAGLDGLHDGTFEQRVTDRWNLASRRHWELLSDIALLHSLTED